MEAVVGYTIAARRCLQRYGVRCMLLDKVQEHDHVVHPLRRRSMSVGIHDGRKDELHLLARR